MLLTRLVAAAGFILFSLLFFWREAFGGFLFCFRDLTYYFYPYRFFMAEAVRHGVLPLWNPYIQLGFPFLATLQTGLFYPLSILYFILPFALGFNWFLIVHYPLAAFFMYLFCRELRFSAAAACGAGIAFAFSGYTISVLSMPTSLAAVTWLPLVILFFSRMINRASSGRKMFRRPDFLWLAIFIALMLLGGEPTILFGTVWALLFYLLAEKFGRWREVGWGLAGLLAAVLIAALLDAVQILPFCELSRFSTRAAGITFAEASGFSLPPKYLLELLIPYFFTASPYPWVNTEWTSVSYLGLVPAVLAGAAVWLGKEKRLYWLAGAALFIILLILGKYSPLPLHYLFYKLVPGFNLFRYPVKFIFILVFILSFLAGKGIDLLVNERRRGKTVATALLAVAAIIGVLVGLACFDSKAAYKLALPLFGCELSQGLGNSITNIVMPRDLANIGLAALSLALIAGWIIFSQWRGLKKEMFGAGLVLLIAADLYAANAGVSFSVPVEKYNKAVPANVRIIQADKELFRCFVSPWIFNRSYYELSNEFGDYGQALLSMREKLTANQGMLYGIYDVIGYESIKGADKERLLNAVYQLNSLRGVRILDLLNVKYLVAPWPLRQSGFTEVRRSRELYKKGEIYLYRNENVLPRGFYVPQASVVASREEALRLICSPGFAPRRQVLLEEKVVSPGGFYFYSEWSYPGWKAYVNGRQAKIYRANYMFRAVPVAGPRDRVTFVYDPPLFKLGAAISLLTLGALIVSFLVLRYTGRDEKMADDASRGGSGR